MPSLFVVGRRCVPLVLALLPAVAGAFDFDDVSRRAAELAAKPHRPPDARLPQVLRDITYDDYRAIRFQPQRSLWRRAELPFELQFFHPGFFFQHTVKVNVVTADGVREHLFDPNAFDYGALDIDRRSLEGLGFAGFRIHYPINRRDYKDEIAVFLGASYFRGVGRHQVYGLSARGLAVDTALPSGEEVPAFREFWIERPSRKAHEVVVYALLDSRRVAGAYRFVITPGVSTIMDVKARLFLREGVGKLGLAPLTSMYFFGENQPPPVEDFRPEVHDSDGLSIEGGDGEWLWRPLVNPKRLLVTSFAQRNPRGFGLMQRDRLFARYEDLEARYHARPSAWVEPRGDWGPGRIELVLIPTNDEFNDNVVAYWVPDPLPAPGKPFDLSYRLSWQMEKETVPPLARVVQTRRSMLDPDTALFIVDFEGLPRKALPADTAPVPSAWVSANAEVLDQRAYRNDVTGGWRLALRVRRGETDQPVELRAALHGKDTALSETWSYVWPLP